MELDTLYADEDWSDDELERGSESSVDDAQESTLQKIRCLLLMVVSPLREVVQHLYDGQESQADAVQEFSSTILDSNTSIGSESEAVLDETEFDDSIDDEPLECLYSGDSQVPCPQIPSWPPIELNSNVGFNGDANVAKSQKSLERCCSEVPCRYASSGCREMVNPCSISEMNHMKSCSFRPIECIVGGCGKDVPCHSFLIHLNQHFMYPVYEAKLTTSVIILAENFKTGGTWMPKWLCAHGRHFFLMLKRLETGLWASWVWTLGSDPESNAYVSRISCFKSMKCITGLYPVHCIRTSQEEIVKSEKCLLISDAMMKSVTDIDQKLVTDLAFNVHIFPQCDVEAQEEEVEAREVCAALEVK